MEPNSERITTNFLLVRLLLSILAPKSNGLFKVWFVLEDAKISLSNRANCLNLIPCCVAPGRICSIGGRCWSQF